MAEITDDSKEMATETAETAMPGDEFGFWEDLEVEPDLVKVVEPLYLRLLKRWGIENPRTDGRR